MEDSFMLYDLKVEVIGSEKPMVCSHKEGDHFLVIGENLVFPENNSFSPFFCPVFQFSLFPCTLFLQMYGYYFFFAAFSSACFLYSGYALQISFKQQRSQ